MSYSPRLVSTLNDIAHKHSGIIRQSIASVLNDAKYKNTGASAGSVVVSVIDGDASKAPIIHIEMAESLLIIDRSKLQWTKLPNMKALLEWAATKVSDPRKAKQLAWATAWSKKKFDIWKPKKWRKKSLSVVLKEMNELVVEEFDRAIEGDLVEAIGK